MTQEDYHDTWVRLIEKQSGLQARRSELEVELSELRTEIAHLNEIIEHLTPLAGLQLEPGSITGLGITDAIRRVLRENGTKMSPNDVYRTLCEKDFDFSSQTQPMASIYKILARLQANDEVRVEKENRNIFYTWKEDDQIQISDEDIPF